MIYGTCICKLHKHSNDEFDVLKLTMTLMIKGQGNQ